MPTKTHFWWPDFSRYLDRLLSVGLGADLIVAQHSMAHDQLSASIPKDRELCQR